MSRIHRDAYDLDLVPEAPPAPAGVPGKRSMTQGLAPRPILFRVESADAARELGAAFGARDGNGVARHADAAVDRAASGSGAPLRTDVRERFESSLGADLSAVRVHTDDASADASAAVGAKAYTVGNDIHFGAGQYRPDDPFGLHLLAHEVAHTVQQAGATPHRQHKLEVSSPSDGAELEADRAADAMVAGHRFSLGASPAALHRKLEPNDQKVFDDQGGSAAIATLKSVASAWSAFRANPHSHKAMHDAAKAGVGAANKLAEICRGAPNFQKHAVAELGGEAIVSLNEMARFTIPGYVNLSCLPGISSSHAKHNYSIKESAAGEGVLPVTRFSMTYTNDLGWKWTRDIKITGVTISVGAKHDGKKASGGGVKPGPMKVDVTLVGDAKNVPLYRGFEDFNGIATVVNGPKVSGAVPGAKVKASSGGALTIHGDPGETSFTLGMTVDPSAGGKGTKFDVSVMGVGGGKASPVGDTQLSMPTITERPVPVTQTYGPYVIHGFATGGETTDPGRVANVADVLRNELQRLRERYEREKDELQKLGIAEPPRFKITCEGYASRIWEAAADDADRKAKNEELSHKRALFVMEQLRGQLDGDHEFAAQGFGAAVRGDFVMAPGGSVGNQPPPEPVTESMQPGEVAAKDARVTGSSTDLGHYSKKSNDDEVRQVRVTARYDSYKLGVGYGKNQETTIADQ